MANTADPSPVNLSDLIAELLFEVIVAEVAKIQTVSGNPTNPKK